MELVILDVQKSLESDDDIMNMDTLMDDPVNEVQIDLTNR